MRRIIGTGLQDNKIHSEKMTEEIINDFETAITYVKTL